MTDIGWHRTKVKYAGRVVSGGTPDSGNPDYWDGPVPWLTPVDLGKAGSVSISGSARTISFAGVAAAGLDILPAGSVIVSTRAPIGSVGLLASEATTNQGCKAIVPGSGTLNSLFGYYRMLAATQELQSCGLGTTFSELSTYAFRNLEVVLPPICEQQRIAPILADQIEKIDRLIALRRRQMDLLLEQRAALIRQTVAHGLAPSVPMKDSGLPWLGQIPRHWEVIRTKFVARLELGHTPSRQHPEWWENCTIPWVSLADVGQFRTGLIERIYETAENVSELGLANSSARLLPSGTVLLSRTASVGFSVIAGVPLATTQDFVNWICGPRLLPEYLLYVFRSMQQEFERITSGSTHQTIYMPDVADFVTPLPPIEEQWAIYDYIKDILPRIDSGATAALSRYIDVLIEYRSALIHETVTGQRAVAASPTDIAEAA